MTRVAPSGSKIHRIWQCPPSAILPQIDDGSSPIGRRRGKAIHAYLERVRQVGVDGALGECGDPELLPLLKAIDIEALPTHLATEVAFAYDWSTRTARELGRGIDRAYDAVSPPLATTEIPMTLDLVGGQTIGGMRRGYVGDYKSGHTKYPAPDKFGQTLLGAVAVRSVYQCEEVVAELLHIHDKGDHHRVRRTLDQWDMDIFADEIEAAMLQVDYAEEEYRAGRGVAVREGPHCDYCPAFKQCPAKVALVRAIPAELAAIPPAGAISRAEAALLWMRLEAIDDVISRVKQEICGLAAFEPIDLPDGRVIGFLRTERRALDGTIAAEVLEQMYGREARDEAVEISVSMDALRKAVVARKAESDKISTVRKDGIFDRVLAEIEKRGGIGLNASESVKPHVPRKRLKAPR